MPKSKSKYTLKDIDKELEECGNKISKIDEQIRKLKQYRVKFFDKYSYYRYLRIKIFHRDILITGLWLSNEIESLEDSEKYQVEKHLKKEYETESKPDTESDIEIEIENILEEEESIDDEFGGEEDLIDRNGCCL
jgi:hypothetical protein